MATTSVQVVQVPPPPRIVVPPPQPIHHSNTIKGLAITQLVIGLLGALISILSIFLSVLYVEMVTSLGAGIWGCGVIGFAGLLGVCHTRKHTCNGAYMTFSIMSAIVSAVAGEFFLLSIVFYSGLPCGKPQPGQPTWQPTWQPTYGPRQYEEPQIHTYMGYKDLSYLCGFKSLGLVLHVPSLIMMIVEFFVSIVAVVYCCKSSRCCHGNLQGVVIHQQPYMQLVEECGDSTNVATPAGPTVITGTSGYPTNNVQYPPQYVGQMAPQYVGQVAPQHSIQMQNPIGYGEQVIGAAEQPPMMYSEKRLVDI